VVYPLPPKPAEPEREKPPPSSSGGTGGKSSSKQIITFLAIAAVLLVAGLIYLVVRASQSPPPQSASVSLTAIASPTPVTAPSSSVVAGSPAIIADDSQPKKKLVVGFSTIGAASGWRLANTESIKSEAAKRGIDLRFSDAQRKEENQIKAIRAFIAEGVDVIALSPVVETGYEAVLREAKKAGIPVIFESRDKEFIPEPLSMTQSAKPRIPCPFSPGNYKGLGFLQEFPTTVTPPDPCR